MSIAEYSCSWCGAEYWAEEIGDELIEFEDEYKCKTCIVEECHHQSTWTDYVSSNSQRAKFLEHCTGCSSWRIYRFYFHTKTQRLVGPWRHDDVDEEAEE